MPGQRGAASAHQEAEPVAQAVEDLLHRKRSSPNCRKLDRQRQAIQPPADVGDRRPIRRGQLECPRRCGRPLDEEHHRFVLPQPAAICGGQLQRGYGEDVLPRHVKRLAAGGDHPQARRGTNHLIDELEDPLDQVLAVVQHQKQLLVREVRPQQGERFGRCLVAQVHRGHHGVAHQRRVPDLRQLDQPRAVPEPARQIARGPDREPGLAHAARSHQAHHPRRRQLLAQLGQLAAAADEARGFRGQVTQTAGGLGHRETASYYRVKNR